VLAALDPLSLGILGTIIGTIAGVISGAAVKQVMKRRDSKVFRSADVEKRLDVLETRFDTLNAGLFGKDDDFGHTIGFVDEVRSSLRLISTIHAEVTPNGGGSMKDVSNETHRRQEDDPQ
jgi:hypothetical protein